MAGTKKSQVFIIHVQYLHTHTMLYMFVRMTRDAYLKVYKAAESLEKKSQWHWSQFLQWPPTFQALENTFFFFFKWKWLPVTHIPKSVSVYISYTDTKKNERRKACKRKKARGRKRRDFTTCYLLLLAFARTRLFANNTHSPCASACAHYTNFLFHTMKHPTNVLFFFFLFLHNLNRCIFFK